MGTDGKETHGNFSPSNFATEKESGLGLVEFSPGFKFALGVEEDGHYLGIVQIPQGQATQCFVPWLPGSR
jgi:hypothetical protein